MTEELEKKAEEYVKEQILKHNRDVVLRPKNAITYIDELKQAYLDGLAEGKRMYRKNKEKRENASIKIGECLLVLLVGGLLYLIMII